MYDQANHLRKLALSAADDGRAATGDAPCLIAVGGGKGGVGTTTLAVNLATALARDGRRTLLVDADLESADVAALCRLHDGYTVADVLTGRRTVHEAIQRGPCGVQVLPGPWAPATPTEFPVEAQQRFLRQLRGLSAHAEFIILDAGSGSGRVARGYWRAADAVLVVTSPELVSVMDAYASIKVHLAGHDACAVYSIVNLATDAATADDVHARLERACGRFLGLSIAAAGHVPFDALAAEAAASGRSFFLDEPNCPAAASVDNIAQRLIADCQRRGAAQQSPLAARPLLPVAASA